MGCQKKEETLKEPVECESLQDVVKLVDFSLNRADVLTLHEDMSYTVKPTEEGLVVIAKTVDDTYMVVVADGIDLTSYAREGSYNNEFFSEETVNYLVSSYFEPAKTVADFWNENYYIHAAESLGGEWPYTNECDVQYMSETKFYEEFGPTSVEYVSEDDETVTLKAMWGQHEMPETTFSKDTLPTLTKEDVDIKGWGPNTYSWLKADVTIEFIAK